MTEDPTGSFLRQVATGSIADVRAALDATPHLMNQTGPHPFWGGRPQPLHVAIETGRRDVFDVLLEHGADVNGSNDDYDCWSPLMIAIQRGRVDMRDALLRRGAPVGLAEALMLEDDDRVADVLASGGLPERVPNGGSFVAFARTPTAIDRLVASGASIDRVDRWGTTPIDAVSQLGVRGRPLVRHLMALTVVAKPWHHARTGDLEALAALAEADPSIVRLDAVMMAAVEGGHHELVRWLLDHGGQPDARADARSRQTALHSAAWNGDLEMVRLLVRAGADRTARDQEHQATPLGWAQTAITVTNNPMCAEVAAFLREE